ncbi:ATP-binding protein [Streptomyces calidiresistens]|uniref:ATP-binding protein n=1 Tax=Streptomyces calidiresistens TaxID=1485586 RepID=UPI002B21C901|nr:ATP-binding protein [Streptomyces calidiresistens]
MTAQQTADGARPPHPPTHHLSLSLSGTRRGARLARLLAVQQFTEWTGLPYASDTVQAVALVTAELAANAVAHGSPPGRDFRLGLLLLSEPVPVVRIEVTDTRPERRPSRLADHGAPDFESSSGRGLLLVEAHAERWGCETRDAETKTVWAEVRRER